MNRRTRHKALVWVVRPVAASRARLAAADLAVPPGPGPVLAPEVLLLQRPDGRGGGLHPVTGRAERGEAPLVTAAREAREETGLDGALHDLGFLHEFTATRPGKRETRWIEHAFLLAVAPGSEPTLSGEHIAARWEPGPEVPALLEWAAHREALRLALAAWSAVARARAGE